MGMKKKPTNPSVPAAEATGALTYGDALQLFNALTTLKTSSLSSDLTFKLANVKNRALLQPVIAIIDEAKDPGELSKKFNAALQELQQQHIDRFENGTMKFTRFENGREHEVGPGYSDGIPKWKDSTAYFAAFDQLKNEHKEALEDVKQREQLYVDLLGSPIDQLPVLVSIPEEHLPDAIAEEVLDIFFKFKIVE